MSFLAVIIAHTPLWAWAVLAVLIVLGLSRTRDRVVNAPRLVLMPLVVTGLAISNLLTTNGSLEVFLGAGIGILAGIAAGFAQERNNGAERVERGVLRIKGEWVSLVVLLAIFLTRYVTIVIGHVDPALASGAEYHFVVALLSTFFVNMLLARTVLRLRVAYA